MINPISTGPRLAEAATGQPAGPNAPVAEATPASAPRRLGARAGEAAVALGRAPAAPAPGAAAIDAQVRRDAVRDLKDAASDLSEAGRRV